MGNFSFLIHHSASMTGPFAIVWWSMERYGARTNCRQISKKDKLSRESIIRHHANQTQQMKSLLTKSFSANGRQRKQNRKGNIIPQERRNGISITARWFQFSRSSLCVWCVWSVASGRSFFPRISGTTARWNTVFHRNDPSVYRTLFNKWYLFALTYACGGVSAEVDRFDYVFGAAFSFNFKFVRAIYFSRSRNVPVARRKQHK